MCEPTTIALGMMAVSGALTAYGQHKQGDYQKDMAEYNAAVDRNKATQVANKARAAESAERAKARQLVGKQRAAAAARGVSVDFGTPAQLQADAEMVGEMNALRVRQNAGEQMDALESSALITESQGEMAQSQGNLGALATIVGGAGKIAGMTSGGGSKVNPKWHTTGSSGGGGYSLTSDMDLSFLDVPVG